MKIIVMLLVILALLYAAMPAHSQTNEHQITAGQQQPTDPEFKKWLNENVVYIITPEERKIFKSGPFLPSVSLLSRETESAPAAVAEIASTGDSDTDLMLAQGDHEIVLLHTAAATELFQKVLDKYPSQPRATYGLAIASALGGNGDLAKNLLEKLAADPTSVPPGLHGSDVQTSFVVAWSHVYLGRIHELEGDKKSAVREYEAALTWKDAPEPARDAAQRGVDYHKTFDETETPSQTATVPAVNPEEEAAFRTFATESNNDEATANRKIQLGRNFIDTYPASRYIESVYNQMLVAYYVKRDWNHFYAIASDVLAKDPDDIDVLTVVGWVIPHFYYDPDTPAAAEKLNQAEAYEKHAIELIPIVPKPDGISEAQFTQAKAKKLSQAHSGLGLAYFRAQDFGNSARELQISLQGIESPDPTDIYTLGVALHHLGRDVDAADAFTKCSQIPGELQDRCKKVADLTNSSK